MCNYTAGIGLQHYGLWPRLACEYSLTDLEMYKVTKQVDSVVPTSFSLYSSM